MSRQRGCLPPWKIAEDPHDFILRRHEALDFGDEREIAQLRRLRESTELEIIRVLEAINQLKESPDYELHRLTTGAPSFFDETVCMHVESLEKELTLLESEAEPLAKEIEELTGGKRCHFVRARLEDTGTLQPAVRPNPFFQAGCP